jgi:hypothetical protein
LLVRAFGPDELRERLGPELALELLEGAGEETARIQARWDAERQRQESTTRQVTTTYNSLADDPRHDPRVTDAIMAGASDAELRRITQEVVAEYGARIELEAAVASRRRDLMWTDAATGRPVVAGEVPLPIGAAHDPYTGNPVQKTLTVNESVPELGSEVVPPPYMGDIREAAPVVQPCTSHLGQPGDRYCREGGPAHEH